MLLIEVEWNDVESILWPQTLLVRCAPVEIATDKVGKQRTDCLGCPTVTIASSVVTILSRVASGESPFPGNRSPLNLPLSQS